MKLLAILASAGLLAAAQNPYSTPAQESTLTGTIASFDGKYHLRLRDDRGTFDDITLHQGTVITPSGQRLTAGLRVTISGAADGSTFDADQIDVAPEDASASEDYSPGPYTPLFGGTSTFCNTWDCPTYGSCGGYSGACSYPGYYPGYYSGYYSGYYYGAPYVVAPPVILVPAPPNGPHTPAPFHLRRPLAVPQQAFPVAQPQQAFPVAQPLLPHHLAAPPPPAAPRPAPLPQPHLRAVMHAGGGPHH